MIVIPAKPQISAREVHEIFGYSPQLCYYYRKAGTFPRSKQGMYETSNIVAYFRSRGVDVRIV